MEDKIIKETKYFTTYLRPDGSTYQVFKRQPVELNTNLERYTQPTDKTTVAPKIDPKVKDNAKNASEEHKRNLLATGEYVEHKGLLVHIPRNNTVITADTRTDWQRKKSQEDYLNHLKWEERRKQKELETKVGLGLGLGTGVALALATPAGPAVNAGLFALSAGSLANLYLDGTLGFNLETGMNTLGLIPGLQSLKAATIPMWAPKLYNAGVKNIRNYRMARAFNTDKTGAIEYATYLPKFTPLKLLRYTDKYGKEIIPTPYKGSDDDLINVVIETHINTLKDYFTNPKKIELIKRTMNWGDAEINELRSELMRTLGKTSKVEIKSLEDGFNNIALHRGTLVGTGKDAKMLHTVTLNKDRIPNILMAEEGAIHEVGAHGKTASMNAADFGKGGNSDLSREAFPRLAELVLKNKELADLILVLNRKGRLLNSVNKPSGLELHFDKHKIPWERYPKYQNALKRFRYVTSPPEIEARAYTGQLFERLHPEAPKTTNILLLKEYFTSESVENFKKAVLGIPPAVIGVSSLQDNKNKEEN